MNLEINKIYHGFKVLEHAFVDEIHSEYIRIIKSMYNNESELISDDNC